MTDRGLVVAAMIVGGAIVAGTYQTQPRYALSAATNNVAWRMDTWSGQIDICAAAYLAEGPLVSCGALIVGNPFIGNGGPPPTASPNQSPTEQQAVPQAQQPGRSTRPEQSTATPSQSL